MGVLKLPPFLRKEDRPDLTVVEDNGGGGGSSRRGMNIIFLAIFGFLGLWALNSATGFISWGEKTETTMSAATEQVRIYTKYLEEGFDALTDEEKEILMILIAQSGEGGKFFFFLGNETAFISDWLKGQKRSKTPSITKEQMASLEHLLEWVHADGAAKTEAMKRGAIELLHLLGIQRVSRQDVKGYTSVSVNKDNGFITVHFTEAMTTGRGKSAKSNEALINRLMRMMNQSWPEVYFQDAVISSPWGTPVLLIPITFERAQTIRTIKQAVLENCLPEGLLDVAIAAGATDAEAELLGKEYVPVTIDGVAYYYIPFKIDLSTPEGVSEAAIVEALLNAYQESRPFSQVYFDPHNPSVAYVMPFYLNAKDIVSFSSENDFDANSYGMVVPTNLDRDQFLEIVETLADTEMPGELPTAVSGADINKTGLTQLQNTIRGKVEEANITLKKGAVKVFTEGEEIWVAFHGLAKKDARRGALQDVLTAMGLEYKTHTRRLPKGAPETYYNEKDKWFIFKLDPAQSGLDAFRSKQRGRPAGSVSTSPDGVVSTKRPGIRYATLLRSYLHADTEIMKPYPIGHTWSRSEVRCRRGAKEGVAWTYAFRIDAFDRTKPEQLRKILVSQFDHTRVGPVATHQTVPPNNTAGPWYVIEVLAPKGSTTQADLVIAPRAETPAAQVVKRAAPTADDQAEIMASPEGEIELKLPGGMTMKMDFNQLLVALRAAPDQLKEWIVQDLQTEAASGTTFTQEEFNQFFSMCQEAGFNIVPTQAPMSFNPDGGMKLNLQDADDVWKALNENATDGQ